MRTVPLTLLVCLLLVCLCSGLAPSTFAPRTFSPPALLRNNHVQTIGGALFRRVPQIPNRVPSSPAEDFWDDELCVPTADGDSFRVVAIRNNNSGNDDAVSNRPPLHVLLMHGLESNSESNLIKSLAVAFLDVAEASSVHCLNFRGCTDLEQTTPGGYHVGFTDDLRAYVEILIHEEPNVEIFISGFSLGGNAALKYLGEGEVPSQVIGASVLSVPYNCTANQKRLDEPGFNQIVYSGNFLETLLKKATAQRDAGLLPPNVDYNRVMSSRTIGEIDDSFIAPIYGFDDRYDYYSRNSCCKFLAAIRVPFYIVGAADDPFFDHSFRAVEGDDLPLMRTNYLQYGGHCGFIGDEKEGDSFATREVARFAKHVRE